MSYHGPNNDQNHGELAICYPNGPQATIAAGSGIYTGCQRLYKAGAIWYLFNHVDAVTHTPLPASQDYWDPRFFVRGLKVEGSSHSVHFDMPFDDRRAGELNDHCIELFAVEQIHRVQVTRLYLYSGGEFDANTNVDAITLYY